MMNTSRRRAAFVLLHIVLGMLIPATQAPSDPAGLEILQDAPNTEELAFFEELGAWIREDPEALPHSEAIRDNTFDFFANYHDEDVRNARLEAVPFGEVIQEAAQYHGLDALLVAAVIEAESSFDPRAISHRGAVGLMQVLPTTAQINDPTVLQDPASNIAHGTRYLRSLLELYGGDLELALAAYNAGPGNVRRYGGVPPFRETRHYVEKVLDLYIDHHRTVWQGSETGELLAAS